MQNITRREFLNKGVLLAGGGICVLTAGSGLLFPQISEASKFEFPESTCGARNEGQNKILIAYASMSGSTGEVAESIGEVLCAAGATVDVRLVNKVKDLRPYNAFVVGSAVRSDMWLPEAKNFIVANCGMLMEAPVAYFLTCLTLVRSTEESRRKARSFIKPMLDLVPEVHPVDIGFFAGVLDYSKFSFGMRAVMKYKMWTKGVQEGDYRNWDAIRTWAKSLRPKLMSPQLKQTAVS